MGADIRSPTLQDLRDNPSRYDIIYLSDYSEVTIDANIYERRCVPAKEKSLVYYVLPIIQKIGLGQVLKTPANLDHFESCYNYYYVRR